MFDAQDYPLVHFKLDLRIKTPPSASYGCWMAENMEAVTAGFNDWLERLAQKNLLHGHDLLLTVFSRNPYACRSFDFYARLMYCDNMFQAGIEPAEILVDHDHLAIALRSLVNKYQLGTVVRSSIASRYKWHAKIVAQLLFTPFWLAWVWFLGASLISRRLPPQCIVLLDEFLDEGNIVKGGRIHDRYFEGFESEINAELRPRIWRAPVLLTGTSLLELFKALTRLARSTEQVLVQEAWLRFEDYFWALRESYSAPRRIKKIDKEFGIDISPIVTSIVTEQILAPSLIACFTRIAFVRRLKEANIQLSGVVSWNEGQPIQKALYHALALYYPTVSTRGYQGFVVPPDYFCATPTDFEIRHGLTAKELFVCSNISVDRLLRARVGLPVNAAPAFRFRGLFELKKTEPSTKIVFLLPISVPESITILRAYNALFESSCDTVRTTMFVKFHPELKRGELERYDPAVRCFELNETQRNTGELLQEAKVLISAVSSACVEAIALGIPLIILRSSSGRPNNPVDTEEYRGGFHTLENACDLTESLVEQVAKRSHPERVESVFFPVTEMSTEELFTFGPKP